jgi:hypothetical protein
MEDEMGRHEAQMEARRKMCRILVGKLKGMKLLGRPKQVG